MEFLEVMMSGGHGMCLILLMLACGFVAVLSWGGSRILAVQKESLEDALADDIAAGVHELYQTELDGKDKIIEAKDESIRILKGVIHAFADEQIAQEIEEFVAPVPPPTPVPPPMPW